MLIKLHFRETCITVRIGIYLSDTFPIRNGVKQGDHSLPVLLNLALE